MSQKTISAEDVDRIAGSSPAPELDLDQIRGALKGIRHGEIRVIVQDGRIVQIDRLEKRRLR